MEIWAAIDLSGKDAFFAAGSFPEKKVLIQSSSPMKGRDSSSLLEKVEGILGQGNLSIGDVKRWTVGTGPGNYTGLRIVAALVSGITFKKEGVLCRGIPSAHAILSDMLTSDNESAAVIYPFESGKIFSYGASMIRGNISVDSKMSGVLSADEFIGKFPGIRYAVLERDIASVPVRIAGGAHVISEFPVQNLVFANPESWEACTVRDLIYIRPAVNVEPMQIRTEI